MGEWSWLAAAGPARVGGVPGPAGLSRPVYGAAQGPSALPSAIPLTFASRSGSSSGALVPGCSLGSLAFEPRPSSACPARATWREDVCVSGGTSPLVTASKRVSPFGPVLRRRRCFGRAHLMSPSAGAVSPGEEWSRPKLGRRPARVGVGEFTVPPELADTQPHPKSALAQAKAASGLARW